MKIFDKFKISNKKENHNQQTQTINNYSNMSEYQIEVLRELKEIHKGMNRIFRKTDRIELRVETLEKEMKLRKNDNKNHNSNDLVK